MRFAQTATWGAAIEGLIAEGDMTVALSDVLRQRKAFVDFSSQAQEHLPLEEFLAEAAKYAAVGCKAPMAKVLELRTSDNALIVSAQWGLRPEVVGRNAGVLQPDNPPARALITARPAVAQTHTWPSEHLPEILREFHVASSINIPLIGRDGPYGVLEVDYAEPFEPGALELSYLGSVASVVADGVERAREMQHLVSDRELKVVLLREQQHRIRNNFQTIIGLLQVSEQVTRDAEAKRRFTDVTRRVFALVSLYDHLLGLGEQDSEVSLGDYLTALCANFSAFYDLAGQGIDLELSLDPAIKVGIDGCTGLGTVVNELLANAVEHAFGDDQGRIHVVLRGEGAGAFALEVRDNGKGYDASSHDSIGLQTARRLIANIGGSLQMVSSPDQGTTWKISMAQPG